MGEFLVPALFVHQRRVLGALAGVAVHEALHGRDPHFYPHVIGEVQNVLCVQVQRAADQTEGVGELPAATAARGQ